ELAANQAGRRLKGNVLGPVSNFVRKPRETTCAVSTHFRLPAVAIVIAHPEIGAVRAFLEQKNSVRAYTAMAIANPDDLFRTQLNIAGPIVDHDEIISGTVHLRKAQHAETVGARAISRKQRDGASGF